MRFYKYINENYIVSIGIGEGNTEITQEEYDTIMEVIHNKPIAEEGYDYLLKTDLTWEKVAFPVNEDEEITDTEALEIITGGANDE